MDFKHQMVDFRTSKYVAKNDVYSFQIVGRITNTKTLPFSVFISHVRKDIIYNSLWDNLRFISLKQAKNFCVAFDHKEHKCVGEHAKKQQ